MGFNGAETARRLKKSEDTISRYRSKGVPKCDGEVVALACAAIAMKIPKWTQR